MSHCRCLPTVAPRKPKMWSMTYCWFCVSDQMRGQARTWTSSTPGWRTSRHLRTSIPCCYNKYVTTVTTRTSTRESSVSVTYTNICESLKWTLQALHSTMDQLMVVCLHVSQRYEVHKSHENFMSGCLQKLAERCYGITKLNCSHCSVTWPNVQRMAGR